MLAFGRGSKTGRGVGKLQVKEKASGALWLEAAGVGELEAG